MKNFLFIISFLLISIVTLAKKDKSIDNRSTTPLAGKMYFSNQPFTSSSANSKKNFVSNEFIYGRLELPGQTIKDAFKISEAGGENLYPSLMCKLLIFKDGEQQGFGLNESHLLLKRDDLQRTWINFDVLPEPSKAATLFSIYNNFFEEVILSAPLYNDINQSKFPESGKYTVRLELYYEVKDTWGNTADQDEWPKLVSEFEYAFNESDVAKLTKNREEVTKVIRESDFRNNNLKSWASTSTGSGKNVPGKISFSDKPFAAGNTSVKTNFISNEFIYSRLELSGSSLKDAFKLRETTGHNFLVCEIEILKNGQPVGYHKSKNNYILLSKDDLDKTWLNLDILPEPNKASTLYSMLDDFSAGYGYTPLYSMVNPDYFPSGGTYRLNVRVFSKTVDAWDRQEDQDKWPFVEDGFDFTLRETDIATLKKNHLASWDVMKANAFRYDKLPPVFSNPGKLTDPNATSAKIAAILKRDLPQRQIIKWVAETYNGTYWSIAKDDYGLPKYKYFNPHIWIAYKSEGKCYIGYVTLRQVYSGGGTYAALAVAWTSTKDDKGIDCEKVK